MPGPFKKAAEPQDDDQSSGSCAHSVGLQLPIPLRTWPHGRLAADHWLPCPLPPSSSDLRQWGGFVRMLSAKAVRPLQNAPLGEMVSVSMKGHFKKEHESDI